jgi:4-amino-4-deoxychorismate lyase
MLRLQQACDRLKLEFSAWAELTQQVFKSVTEFKHDCVVKILISRGQGGRGYSPVGCHHPSYIITHHAMPNLYENWQESGIQLSVSSITLAKQPLLAGIKHLNRLEQVLIKHELSTTNFDDVLVCDTDGAVIETSVGNVFWKKSNQWFTPNLSHSGVEGVMRNQLIALLTENGIDVQIVQQSLDDLDKLEDMFICNSLMKIVPVSHIYRPEFDSKVTVLNNTDTKSIQLWLEQALNQAQHLTAPTDL